MLLLPEAFNSQKSNSCTPRVPMFLLRESFKVHVFDNCTWKAYAINVYILLLADATCNDSDNDNKINGNLELQ